MPASLEGKLVVAISSRAVFDFEEENRVFERDDDAAYMALQRERLDVSAQPGVAWALVRKLLQFDPPGRPEAQRRIEVVVVSRNDPVSGLRVFRSAQQAGLRLERGVFTRGRAPWRYLAPLILGEDYPPYKEGLPQYVTLKNVAVPKKLGEFKV